MKCLVLPAILCAALSGCAHPETSEDVFAQTADRPVVMAQAPQINVGFCRNVAAHDASLVMYDNSAHDRVFAVSYSRCLSDFSLSDNGLRVADLRIGANSY